LRKAKREITDKDGLAAVLAACDVCRIGLYDAAAAEVYIVPLNFGYDFDDGRLTLWFHCAREGRKLDLVGDGSKAGFEMDCKHALRTGDTACRFSMNYESIIGSGFIRPAINVAEKMHGLERLMAHYGGSGLPFSEEPLALAAVLRLDVEMFTGKRLNK
jgi:nitroimidazol reductase NimA-like FMN-containing flavoprotein (pyridoxamine 5'-phosphate oxidase superfamily)